MGPSRGVGELQNWSRISLRPAKLNAAHGDVQTSQASRATIGTIGGGLGKISRHGPSPRTPPLVDGLVIAMVPRGMRRLTIARCRAGDD